VIKKGIYISEYGDNASRQPVEIIRSRDGGLSWSIVYTFPAGSIKHAHGVYFDSYINKLWIPTGDFKGECFMMCADLDFKEVITHGDGGQRWRAVGMFFTNDKVIWAMDSPLERSYIQSLDRKNLVLSEGQSFPGPVWYTKCLSDGIALLQTSVEVGQGVIDNSSHIFASIDMHHWVCVASYKKDILPMKYFKWGVISFSDGAQTSDNFSFFGEALKGLDGRAYSASLEGFNFLSESNCD